MLFPDATTFALPAIGSDHSPILEKLFPQPVKRVKEFGFEVYWLEDKECVKFVKEVWLSPKQKGTDLPTKL